MNKQVILKLAAGFMLLSILLTACGSPGVINTADPNDGGRTTQITLGAVEDLTGRNGIYGTPIKMGIDLAVKQINEQKYLGSDITLKVDYIDTASDTDKAVEAFKKLVADPNIIAILGSWRAGRGQLEHRQWHHRDRRLHLPHQLA
jgi:branched-chain amino acid transport system substrate-binding protein